MTRRRSGILAASALFVLASCGGGGGGAGSTPTPTAPAWTVAASSTVVMDAPAVTLLANGTVLALSSGPILPASAATFDPASNAWTPTQAPSTARFGATATRLVDGRVLVAGGAVESATAPPTTTYLSSAEIYDPATRAWTLVASMPSARVYHAAVLLPGGTAGKVLIVGGDNAGTLSTDSVLYDVGSNQWTSATTVATPGDLPTATVLGNGKVLTLSGAMQGVSSQGECELYDPGSNSWAFAQNTMRAHVLGATATALSDGRVLVVGGQVDIQGDAMSPPEIYDPVANLWSAAGTMAQGRKTHTATLIAGGKVLVAGGQDNLLADYASTEIYDPATNQWTSSASMTTARDHHGAVLLPSGAVFVTGGQIQGSALQSSERYQ